MAPKTSLKDKKGRTLRHGDFVRMPRPCGKTADGVICVDRGYASISFLEPLSREPWRRSYPQPYENGEGERIPAQVMVDLYLKNLERTEPVDFHGANLKGILATRRNFTNVNLAGADLTGAILRECNFDGAVFPGAISRMRISVSQTCTGQCFRSTRS